MTYFYIHLVRIVCKGSFPLNYKKSHSIVILAVCDVTYEFILVDIGESGRNSDGGVLANSNLGIAMNDGLLKFPEPRTLPGTSKTFPYVLVADEAFPLKPFMVKSYAKNILDERKRVCNYRISRARWRTLMENSYGICASRFRIFRRPIIRKVDTVVAMIKAVVSLHNYLMRHESNYCPAGYADADTPFGTRSGEWREEFQNSTGMVPIGHQGSNNFTRSANEVREAFSPTLIPVQDVHWQWDMVNRTADSNESDRDSD